jgi:hypothetical protein
MKYLLNNYKKVKAFAIFLVVLPIIILWIKCLVFLVNHKGVNPLSDFVNKFPTFGLKNGAVSLTVWSIMSFVLLIVNILIKKMKPVPNE